MLCCLWNIHICNLNQTFQQSRGTVPQTRWARGDCQTRTQPVLQSTLLAPQPLNEKREKRRMRHQLQLAVLLLGSTGIWIALTRAASRSFPTENKHQHQKKKLATLQWVFLFSEVLYLCTTNSSAEQPRKCTHCPCLNHHQNTLTHTHGDRGILSNSFAAFLLLEQAPDTC